MTQLIAAIEVPLDDEAELATLRDRLQAAMPPVHSRALDGDTVAQLVVSLTAISVPVLKTWLVTRAQQRKSTVVSWKGRRFVGYSVDEVAELAERLSRTLDTREGDAGEDKSGDSS